MTFSSVGLSQWNDNTHSYYPVCVHVCMSAHARMHIHKYAYICLDVYMYVYNIIIYDCGENYCVYGYSIITNNSEEKSCNPTRLVCEKVHVLCSVVQVYYVLTLHTSDF